MNAINQGMLDAYRSTPSQNTNQAMLEAYYGQPMSTNAGMLSAFRQPSTVPNEAMVGAYRTVPKLRPVDMDLDMFGGNGGPEWTRRRANNAMRAAHGAQMHPSVNAAMLDAFYNQTDDYDYSPNGAMRRAYYANSMPFGLNQFPPVVVPFQY